MPLPRARPLAVFSLALAVLLGPACGSTRPFHDAEPMTVDPDQEPFAPPPSPYFSGLITDGLDQMMLRPISNFFAVDPGGEALNATALDEVADSSWFHNRIGAGPLPLDALREGACAGAPALDPAGPWLVTGGKPNGENPGFFIKANGARYLLKFDGAEQQPRATAADAVVSRIYWVAGYHVPCNRIVEFDRAILTIEPGATSERSDGTKEPLTEAMVSAAFDRAMRLSDGRYRGNASLYLSGTPLGPWRYESTRDDDRNDVIAHEDRRELRGAAVLAAWVNHFDSREQNTLDMWIATAQGRGFVRHHYIDFGDCFGSLWQWDSLSRRWGHSYFFYPQHILADLFTFGALVRPWDDTEFGPGGDVLGYYDVERFDPDAWFNEYPNPAFSRMTERDAAWMARIIARFSVTRIDALIETGKLHDDTVREQLRTALLGRRKKILDRFLTALSPLADPRVVGGELCLTDLAVASATVATEARSYSGRAWVADQRAPVTLSPRTPAAATVCVTLPEVAGDGPRYLIVDVHANALRPGPPVRVHLYQHGAAELRIVGLERPESPAPDDPPDR
ncbi:MAG: hypothetical protein CVU56_00735 [Deltaproteobacteria bacterium HGW-Deltaproteobacteria-14]|nr:MAG: hypothetical protein CVU56_00735 [Deltaproteobacteria bacterium HGW-Deltaproteobacteria-14]